MKRVGIVSCYFKHNYGSMLQAYATQLVLDKLGIENETIDISGFSGEINKAKMKYFIKASFTSDILFQKIGMVKNVIKKKLEKNNEYGRLSVIRAGKFDEFKDANFRLSKAYASKAELGNECKTNYTDVLVGSDQLWLPGNIAADYYTLSFVPEEVNSIAFSTSFGMSDLPKDSAKKAAVFLKNINHLSVREKSGQDIIKKTAGRDVPVVCDPTLLFTGEEWMEIQQEEPIHKEKYILCYFLGKNMFSRKFASELKEKTGYKIVALAHIDEFVKADDEYADETPLDIGPSEFLNLVRNAEYVCTDSFHCSVFSTLYRKKFFAFRRYTKNTKQSTNNRLDNLFNLLGIKDVIQEGQMSVEDAMKIDVDFDTAHSNLDALRKESYEYLEKSLENKVNTDLCGGKIHERK